jgi:hypothetical protein
MSQRFARCFSVLLVSMLLLGATVAWSQATSTGSVTGLVTDQSGAVIPNADVVLVDTSTQVQLKTTSNAAGRYVIVNVPSGHYQLRVTREGFNQSQVSGIDVTVGSAITVNAQLKVGSTKETVTVEANVVAELQTTNATVGSTIDSKSIQLLPNLGRDVTTLSLLQPAVTSSGYVAGAANDQNTYQLDGGNNSDDMGGTTITYNTNFTGTGGAQTNGSASGIVPTPIESIEEVKVSVAGQGIDFNNSIGSNVQMVTKRGTNAFHGSVYEYYFSTDVGAANSWSNDHTPSTALGLPYTPIVSNHRNRAGFALGGPIAKKKILGGSTYFFVNYEALRFPNVGSYSHLVPTAALRAGIIQVQNTASTAVVQNGVSYAAGAYVPYNLSPTPATAASTPGQPAAAFVGTLGSAVCGTGPCDPRNLGMSPVVSQIWQKYMPLPNDFTSSGDHYNTANFLSQIRQTQSSNFWVGRLDHDFGDRNRFFASYRNYDFSSLTSNQADIGGAIPGDTLGQPSATAPRPQKPTYLVTGLTSNLTSNMTNDFRFNYVRNWWQWSDYTPPTAGQLPGMNGMLEIGNYQSAAGAETTSTTAYLIPFNVNAQAVRQRFWDGHDTLLRDDLSLIKGNHLFQFGASYQHNFDYHSRSDNGSAVNNEVVYVSASGAINFSGYYPASVATGQQANYATLMAEITGMISQPQVIYTRAGSNLQLQPLGTAAYDKSVIPYYNFYWGDTWHIKPTLTLVYGLAYALEMPPVEQNGKQVELVDGAGNLITAQNYLASKQAAALQGQNFNPTIGYELVGNVGSGLKYPYAPFYGEFSPRVAMAWNPSFSGGILGKIFGQGKTVIRGGYGRIYGRLNGVDQVLVPLLSPGFLQGVNCPGTALMTGSCGSTPATPANVFRIGADGLNAPLPAVSNTLPQPFLPGLNGAAEATDPSAIDPNFRPNRTDNVTFTIQRQISRKMTIDVGYIGRRTVNDFQEINLDATPYMYTLGGQQFSQAWANAYISLCGLQAQCANSGATAAQATAIVAPQAFFESALGGTSSAFCKGFSSCTAAVLNNSTMLSALKTDSVSSLWQALNKQASWVPGQTMISGAGQSTAVNLLTSLGYSNYNAGYISYRVGGYHGLTLQSNLTYGRALGTAEAIQATSSNTLLDAFHVGANYGPQSFDYKFVYNVIMYYQPQFFLNQKGILGHLLGGWTISPLFTAQTGAPTAPGFTTTGCSSCQAFGEVSPGGSTTTNTEGAVLASPYTGTNSRLNGVTLTSTAYNGTVVGSNNPTGMGMFANPGQVYSEFRPCVLGYDTSCGGYGYLRSLPSWNLDATVAKDFSLWKENKVVASVIFQITNVLNHMQPGGPSLALGSPATFGAITSQANTPRNMEFGMRIHF